MKRILVEINRRKRISRCRNFVSFDECLLEVIWSNLDDVNEVRRNRRDRITSKNYSVPIIENQTQSLELTRECGKCQIYWSKWRWTQPILPEKDKLGRTGPYFLFLNYTLGILLKCLLENFNCCSVLCQKFHYLI